MTQHGQHYHPDPLPIQRTIHNQETIGEIKAVVTPLPVAPAAAPPAHSGHTRNPIDQLASHSQRVIDKYSAEILAGVSVCQCKTCENFVKTSFTDAIGEALTDMTIVRLALGKQQWEFEQLKDELRRFIEREARK